MHARGLAETVKGHLQSNSNAKLANIKNHRWTSLNLFMESGKGTHSNKG